jgi:hypothetical protein
LRPPSRRGGGYHVRGNTKVQWTAVEADGTLIKSAEQGAATGVWCATSPHLEGKGGVYCEDVDIAEAVPPDSPEPHGVRPWANDPYLAELLWTRSEEWMGAGRAMPVVTPGVTA